MNVKASVAYIGLLLLAGCTATFHLYPIRGEITSQSPVPIIAVHITPPVSGTISLVLPDGEQCNGSWISGPAIVNSAGTSSAPGPTTMDLPAVWDEIFGQGYYVSKVVGERNHGSARLTGAKGTRIELDFLHDLPDIIVIGVGKDDKGNIYKIAP